MLIEVINIFITFAIAIIHTFLKLGFKSIEICLNISYILFEIYSTEIISETAVNFEELKAVIEKTGYKLISCEGIEEVKKKSLFK